MEAARSFDNNNNNSYGNIEDLMVKLMSQIERSNEALVKTNNSINKTLDIHSAQLLSHDRLIKEIFKLADDTNIKLTTHDNEIEQLKLNTELSTSQVSCVVEKSRSKIYEFLDRNSEEEIKYYRVYIRDLYRFLKRYGKASKIERTEKRFYDSIMRGIDDWYPDEKKLRERKEFIDSVKFN